jgi:hypothetical protein
MPPSKTPSREAALFGELVTRLRLEFGWTTRTFGMSASDLVREFEQLRDAPR